MSKHGSSLLDVKNLGSRDILSLFDDSDLLQKQAQTTGHFGNTQASAQNKIVAFVFLEPSTRTRMSFEMAARRWGASTLMFDGGSGTSMNKGETPADAILNIAALKPDALVVRYGQDTAVDELLPKLGLPVLNGGSGASAHPSQALLDAYTIARERGPLDQQRILIIGDIVHSRVARSDVQVFQTLGASVGFCAPEKFLPPAEEMGGIKVFTDLNEGLKWATVCMGLRWQNERHDPEHASARASFVTQFGLNRDRLQSFAADGLIMHPGPINHGAEFSADVMVDSRNRVLKQVTNGVWIRGALLGRALGLDPGEAGKKGLST